jgi:thiamine pyrophosphokinase
MDLRLIDSQDQIQRYCERYPQYNSITLMGPEVFPTVGLETAQEPVIFVDGGARYRVANEGLAVGDGDSYNLITGAKPLDVLLPHAKDYSDFAFVLRSLPDRIQNVQTFGFMGGRNDHQLINFGEAHHFLRLRKDTTIIFDHEVWGLSPGVWRPRIQGIFSTVNFVACEMRIEGLCDYQIKEMTKLQPVTSRGLSNMAHGQIEIECSAPVFIFTERRLHLDRSGEKNVFHP